MKKSLKHWTFLALELLFMAIVPLAIVYTGYGGWGEKANKFKWSFGFLVGVVVVFLILKKVWISPWIEKKRIKAGMLEAKLDTETDQAKILNIEDSLRKARLIETITNWILPILFLILALMVVRAVERAIVTFSGIIGFVLISEAMGFVVCILDALTVESKHREKKK